MSAFKNGMTFTMFEELISRHRRFIFFNKTISLQKSKISEMDLHWHPKPKTALLMHSWIGISSKSGFEIVHSVPHALEHFDHSQKSNGTETHDH